VPANLEHSRQCGEPLSEDGEQDGEVGIAGQRPDGERQDTTFSPNLTFLVWGPVVVLAAGLAWFLGWRAYQKRHGIDIDRRYAEIPIE
jgi:hypothetical protein